MAFRPLLHRSELHEGLCRSLALDDLRLLLIHEGGETYLVENRCGHFRVPLDKGKVENGCITCPVHGMRFRLRDGSVDNRPWEDCDPLRVWELLERDGYLGLDLP